jgi:hypothetical protein
MNDICTIRPSECIDKCEIEGLLKKKKESEIGKEKDNTYCGKILAFNELLFEVIIRLRSSLICSLFLLNL